ncbi:MAG: DUF2231 domain-containing protein [Leptolyngbya sp. IPPAS B-1204]|uniref:DUF2231 domain-containing protein n=1 Tax=Leptolyngbya sp. NK1-12 TaxID=2547451 RepID=A0AA97AI14_9CYAN|nr:DUF2231 domain-containing protein [Leptolyngbya sp. NK1-12]MBF2048377.1 DUF2231 domain-containing protein [Elainella sp. C42_A2020_010]RNJ66607.1 MAG: DUF2231 domain-containing protein [Leptolyngbya sp. IPPAS B-1204]WNZ25079.1 DUF2231 domain-containing protein [Leptolyngbya sp. NK1-12]
MNPELLKHWGDFLGLNGLPYPVPIHPALVHLTLGLFIAAISFDIVAALFPVEKRVFKWLAIPVTRSGLFDVGWYNLLAAAVVTFFTVAAGFFEISLALPLDVESAWGLRALETMILHGMGGVALLTLIVAMTVWRGFQRFRWRKDMARQVQWSYLATGLIIFVLMFLQGTLGAHLGGEFGIHVTAVQLLRLGGNPNQL